MRKIIFLLITACFISQFSAAQKWEKLFNGKDLKGFRQLNGKAPYTVENGEIVGRTVLNEPNSFLATEKEYGDFILELDLKVADSMNSGIQFRSEIKDADDKCNVTDKRTPERVHGYQAEVDPSDRGWSGGIYDEARRGWLYSMENNPAAKKAFRPGQWNHYKIECIGNSIRIWLNGVACSHLIDDMTPKGFIALQVHAIRDAKNVGEEIRWKNIRIQTTRLKKAPDDNVFVVNTLVNTISPDEKRLGYRLLFDGKTMDGWKGANKENIPPVWYVENGTLNVSKGRSASVSSGGDIITREQFGAFDLQFEFRMTDTANSGVKYFVVEKEKTTNGPIGLEYQVLDDDRHPDARAGRDGNRKLASLYDLIPSNKNGREKIAIGEWNRGRIVVYPDNRVEHWINGWKVVEYKRGSPEFLALVAKSKYAKIPDFGMGAKGHILLQEHGTHVAFRSIKIREL